MSSRVVWQSFARPSSPSVSFGLYLTVMWKKVLWLGWMLLGLATACRPTVPAQPTSTVLTPDNLPTPVATLTPDPALTLESPFGNPPLHLAVWVPPEWVFEPTHPGAQALAAQLAAFNDLHADLQVTFVTKSLTGQGGALNYLLYGRPVAPSILPDVLMLTRDTLPAAVASEVIFPLDGLSIIDEVETLYPAAQNMAVVDGLTYGIPFALLGITHLAYDPALLSEPWPRRWDDMVTSTTTRLGFPVSSLAMGQLALQLYWSSGVEWVDEAGRLQLVEGPLTKALTRVAVARSNGLIPVNTIGFNSLDEVWDAYAVGEVNTALVTSERFLAQRAAGRQDGFVAVPGAEAPIPPLVEGWIWAISTPDPARQQVAAELINWLVAPQNLGEWSLAALTPPANRAALALWPEDDYIHFLDQQLMQAQALPPTVDATLLSHFRDGVISVVTQSESAWNASMDIIAAIESSP